MLRSLASLAPLPRGLRAAAPQQINRQLNRSAGHTRAYQAAAGMPEQMAPPKRVFADWTGASAPPPRPPRPSPSIQPGQFWCTSWRPLCRGGAKAVQKPR